MSLLASSWTCCIRRLTSGRLQLKVLDGILPVMAGQASAGKEESRQVQVRLPPWLGGHDILGYAAEAGLKATAVNASEFRWRLETRERYERRGPGLVTIRELTGDGQRANWGALRAIPDPGLAAPLSRQQLFAERDRIIGDRPGDFTALVSALKGVVSTIDHNAMPDAAREGYESLKNLTDQQQGPLFPDLSARFIGVSLSLQKRLALGRVLMHIEEEPDLLQNRPNPPSGETAFGSGWHLSSDLALSRDAYFAPLFLCASPWVWSIACPRIPGLIMYDFGKPVVGRRGEPAELLQAFFPPGRIASGWPPPISAAETAAATRWWVTQLDQFLAELSDFSNFCSADGTFVPRRQFETFLSIEQAGRRLQGIFAHDRDLATRRALAFDAFDTMKGLGIIDLFEGCKLSRAERVLSSLKETLPNQTINLLLLPAERAVQALRSLQDGFLSSRTSGGTIYLPDRRGGDRSWSIDEAVALYLQLVRNANHGFTPERDSNERRDQSLLMAHDGDIDGDIAYLPYMYWLHMLAHPDRFALRLRPRSRQSIATH